MADPVDRPHEPPEPELERLRRRVAELEAGARRFQALVDSGVISVQVYRAGGGCIEVNEAWQRLWGLTPEQAHAYNILQDEQIRGHGFMHLIEGAFHDGRAAQLPAIRYDPEMTQAVRAGRAEWVASAMAPVVEGDGVREVVQLHLSVGELKQTEEELLAHNRELEVAVQARTAELTEKLRLIEEQQAAIRALSTPVLQIWERVLAVPVVGNLGAERATLLLDSLLRAVVEVRAEHVLLDVTGVPLVDAEAVGYLRDAVRATELLGSRCALVGISAAMAETLVELDVQLDRVPTFATLQDGLRHVLMARVARR